MGNNTATSKFWSNFEDKLAKLHDKVRALETGEEFVNSVLAINPGLTKGRSFHKIVMEDLLQAYMDTTWLISKIEEIPIEPYRKVMELMSPDPVSVEDAYKHLRKERNLGLRNVMNGYLPQFITIFGASHEPEIKDVLDDWLDTVEAMSEALLSNEAISMLDRTDRLSRRVEKIYKKHYEQDAESGQQKKTDSKQKGDYENDELSRMMARAEAARLPEAVIKKLKEDFEQMDKMQAGSAEFASMMKSARLILALPWERRSTLRTDIKRVHDDLEKNHYGLEQVKSQITEQLAVQKRTGKPSGKIVCLDGAPGIGKTSLGQSIADATGRKFVRISLGGLSDEHEIRGHRPTYIGAIPGRIIEALKKAGTKNPVILLDELDKIESHSARGKGVESALLEVLDPEQNKTFRDSFLGIEFDLSEVMFICTSNNFREISGPLRDRMEMIRLPAYTSHERLEIARRYIVPRQLEKSGLAADCCEITEDSLQKLVRDYTNEPGVRKLEQCVEKICRKVAFKLETNPQDKIIVTPNLLPEFLDQPARKRERMHRKDDVGIVNGLSVAGGYYGDVMPFEVIASPAKAFSVKATGQLGTSMKESIEKVSTWLRANAAKFDIPSDKIDKLQLHIDAPDDGGKDGPSAGAAILTACLSVLTDIPVRADLAMTGKISLRGHVLGIGGVREKLEGAVNNGIKTVLVPEENAPDLLKVPEEIKRELEIITVSHIDEVLKYAMGEVILSVMFAAKSKEKPTEGQQPAAAQALPAPQQVPLLPAPSGTSPA
ncbi:MAG: S16 family serine protease [Micavibrio sp.]